MPPANAESAERRRQIDTHPWQVYSSVKLAITLSFTRRIGHAGSHRNRSRRSGGGPAKDSLHRGQMPAIGLGTFGSDHVSAAEIAEAVKGAAAVGYRHFDCASVYGNEAEIGASFEEILRGGIKREDLWITSKLWNDKHGEDDVIASCRQSLADLRLDYLDLYLVHWPFPNFHPPGCDVTSRSPDAKPYIHENYMKTWRKMEELVDMGLVRHIGTSNMTIPKLKLVLRDARIKPAVNEMELHPHFQQPELFKFVVENGMKPVGYCPIGSPGRPERDRTPEDTAPTEDPVIVRIAERHGIHPAVVCIKWAFAALHRPLDAYHRGMNAVALGDARDHWILGGRGVLGCPVTLRPSRRANGAVTDGLHPVVEHELEQARLLEVRVHLHLVDRGLNAGVPQNELQLGDGHVRGADVPHQAHVHQLLPSCARSSCSSRGCRAWRQESAR